MAKQLTSFPGWLAAFLALAASLVLGACASGPGDPPYKLGPAPWHDAAAPHSKVESVEALLGQMNTALEQLPDADLKGVRLAIDNLHAGYLALDRKAADHDSLMQLKYAYMNWDRLVRDQLIAKIPRLTTNAELVTLVEALGNLDIILGEKDFYPLADRLSLVRAGDPAREPLVKAFVSLLVRQGDASLTDQILARADLPRPKTLETDGPRRSSEIKPGHMSGQSFDEWTKAPDIGAYERRDGKVFFRGQELRLGDLFFIQEHNDSESLFVAPSDRPTYLYHSGVYVEPVVGGRAIPAIYEAYEAGVRLVPLRDWLSPAFSAWLEHYRIEPGVTTAGWQDRISGIALQMIAEPHGYDVLSADAGAGGDRWINCVSAVLQLVRRSGVQIPLTFSPISGQTADNLKALGGVVIPVPSPEAVVVGGGVRLVGLIDNDFLFRTLARDLVGSRFSELLRSSRLAMKDEGDYGFFRWGIGRVNARDTFWRPLILSLFGYTENTYPDGPTDLMATVLVVEDTIDKLMPEFYSDLVGALGQWNFRKGLSWEELRSDPKVRVVMDKHLSTMYSWFPKN